jgi:hypothetical protein
MREGRQDWDDPTWIAFLLSRISDLARETAKGGESVYDSLLDVACVSMQWLECIGRRMGSGSKEE